MGEARRRGLTRIENPSDALVAVGKENSELHEELAKVYAELDHFRNALTLITLIPGEPNSKGVAERGLSLRSLNS